MKFCILFFLLSLTAKAEDIDSVLKKHIDFFGIKPIAKPVITTNRALYDLGRQLFISPILSGNKNISCMTCHDPKHGTSDGLRLSQTHDGKGLLKRNSQSLFNVGLPARVHMFWDGRVQFDPETLVFQTPEEGFNGSNPLRADITKNLTGALSMQVIFPIVSHEEMRGAVGENDIADAKTNQEAWSLIVKRLTQHEALKKQLQKAYPDVTEFNIGHIGEALGKFIAEEFYSNGSPFHQYIAGNRRALTTRQKEGMRVFIERGKCVACHQGGELGRNTFYASVGVPQYGARPYAMDIGRATIKNEEFKKYWFRVPSLLNLKVTGPYFHNGAYTTIRDVINHYSNILVFLDAFDLNPESRARLPVEVDIMNDAISRREIFSSIEAPFLRNGLNLGENEKEALEDFLTNALMDPKFEMLPLPLR